MSFGDSLRAARLAASMTLAELSKKTGLSVPYLSDIERSRRNVPRPVVIAMLASAVGASRQELYSAAAKQLGYWLVPWDAVPPNGRGFVAALCVGKKLDKTAWDALLVSQ